ncbi:phosphatase PAP2 family protein [Ahrensia sp. R2A130]|uniref:phosphatase PAP2 family protein n=1 Tax=Ahrensia sp. R2A130 TaxID=744979 RepID=UPI0001E0F835|nr:phosphatase PAP2 family protein [Ahrensia sp. R2A130]EFL90477.1 phosphoesterase PA-phosphatase related protein [Ahrensia sp. R2A130]
MLTFLVLDRPTAEWAELLAESGSELYHAAQIVTYIGLAGWMLAALLVCGLTISVSHWRQMVRDDMMKRIVLYADINFAFFAIGISSSLAWIIKNMIGRARPRFMDDMGLLAFEPMSFLARFASFPSGHSATIGAAAMVLTLLVPRYAKLWLSVAFVGGVSRVVVQAHYMTDVVAGLVFGAGLTLWGARHLARRDCMFRIENGWLPNRRRPV